MIGAPKKEVFTTSRAKSGLALSGALAFSAIGLLMIREDPADIVAWACTAFFGLCAAIFALQWVRPFRLSLDQEGFALSGGLRVSPLIIGWEEVDEFFVHSTNHRFASTRTVGYNLKPGSAKRPALVKLNRVFGADNTLPALWQEDPEELVGRLNQCQERALKSRSAD